MKLLLLIKKEVTLKIGVIDLVIYYQLKLKFNM